MMMLIGGIKHFKFDIDSQNISRKQNILAITAMVSISFFALKTFERYCHTFYYCY
jgi:hypothetical protein